jgi:hypothetical protein
MLKSNNFLFQKAQFPYEAKRILRTGFSVCGWPCVFRADQLAFMFFFFLFAAAKQRQPHKEQSQHDHSPSHKDPLSFFLIMDGFWYIYS